MNMDDQSPCPECGNEVRGQGGYLSCECPAPIKSDPPEYSMTMTDDIKTVNGLMFWLQTIANDGDNMFDRDDISEVCGAAAKRLQSMQDSLRSEVARIEKLQPFFTEVSRAVDEARKPQH